MDESVPGGSGVRCCSMCHKYAVLVAKNACDSCWTWFENNVDEYYVKGRGLVCDAGGASTPCKSPSCPICQLKKFWDLVGYQFNYNRCCNCAHRTVLNGFRCSMCNKKDYAAKHNGQQPSIPNLAEVVEKPGSGQQKKKQSTMESSLSRVVAPPTSKSPMKPELKISLSAIRKKFRRKAKEQLDGVCQVLVRRCPLKLFNQTPSTTEQHSRKRKRKRKRSSSLASNASITLEMSDGRQSGLSSDGRQSALSSDPNEVNDYVNGILLTTYRTRQPVLSSTPQPLESPDPPPSPVLRSTSRLSRENQPTPASSRDPSLILDTTTWTVPYSQFAKLERRVSKLTQHKKELDEALRKVKELSHENQELKRRNNELLGIISALREGKSTLNGHNNHLPSSSMGEASSLTTPPKSDGVLSPSEELDQHAMTSKAASQARVNPNTSASGPLVKYVSSSSSMTPLISLSRLTDRDLRQYGVCSSQSAAEEERPAKRIRIYSSDSSSDSSSDDAADRPKPMSRLQALFGTDLDETTFDSTTSAGEDGVRGKDPVREQSKGKALKSTSSSGSRTKGKTPVVKKSSQMEKDKEDKKGSLSKDKGPKRKVDGEKEKKKEVSRKEATDRNGKSSSAKMSMEKSKGEKESSEKDKPKSTDSLKFRIPKRPLVGSSQSSIKGLPPLLQENLQLVQQHAQQAKAAPPQAPCPPSTGPPAGVAATDAPPKPLPPPQRESQPVAGHPSRSIIHILPTKKDQSKSVGFAENLESVRSISPRPTESRRELAKPPPTFREGHSVPSLPDATAPYQTYWQSPSSFLPLSTSSPWMGGGQTANLPSGMRFPEPQQSPRFTGFSGSPGWMQAQQPQQNGHSRAMSAGEAEPRRNITFSTEPPTVVAPPISAIRGELGFVPETTRSVPIPAITARLQTITHLPGLRPFHPPAVRIQGVAARGPNAGQQPTSVSFSSGGGRRFTDSNHSSSSDDNSSSSDEDDACSSSTSHSRAPSTSSGTSTSALSAEDPPTIVAPVLMHEAAADETSVAQTNRGSPPSSPVEEEEESQDPLGGLGDYPESHQEASSMLPSSSSPDAGKMVGDSKNGEMNNNMSSCAPTKEPSPKIGAPSVSAGSFGPDADSRLSSSSGSTIRRVVAAEHSEDSEEEEDDVLDLFADETEYLYEGDDQGTTGQGEEGELTEESADRTPKSVESRPASLPPNSRVEPPNSPASLPPNSRVEPPNRPASLPPNSRVEPPNRPKPGPSETPVHQQVPVRAVTPRVQPQPEPGLCFAVIKSGRCPKADSKGPCEFQHTMDMRSVYQSLQGMVREKRFNMAIQLFAMMTFPDSPFRGKLYEDAGKAMLAMFIKAVLAESRDDLIEHALGMLVHQNFPLLGMECEQIIWKVMPSARVAPSLVALFHRIEKEQVKISPGCWNKLTGSLARVNDWDQTFNAVGAAVRCNAKYEATSEVMTFLFGNALANREKLLAVCGLFRGMDKRALRMLQQELRQEIVDVLAKHEEWGMQRQYLELFDIPVRRPALAPQPAQLNQPFNQVPAADVRRPPPAPTSHIPPGLALLGQLENRGRSAVPESLKRPQLPAPNPQASASNGEMPHQLIPLAPVNKPTARQLPLVVPPPSEPLDRNLFGDQPDQEELAVVAPAQAPRALVEPVHQNQELLNDPFIQQDFDTVANILTRFYAGNRNCPVLNNLVRLIRDHPLSNGDSRGEITVNIVIAIIKTVNGPEGIESIKPLLVDLVSNVLFCLREMDSQHGEAVEDRPHRRDAYMILKFMMGSPYIMDCIDSHPTLLLFAAKCHLDGDPEMEEPANEQELAMRTVEWIHDVLFFLTKFHNAVSKIRVEESWVVEEASIFIPVFQEMEQLKATDEPLYNEVLPALLEYHDACDKNRKAFAAVLPSS